jgi:HEAT repeat protein
MFQLEIIRRLVQGGGYAIWVVAGLAATELAERRRRRTELDEDAFRDLANPDPKVRAVAASRLGRSKRMSARAALESVLRDPDSSVRIAVASALCELGDRAAIPELRAALVDEPDAGVRAVLAASIERLSE